MNIIKYQEEMCALSYRVYDFLDWLPVVVAIGGFFLPAAILIFISCCRNKSCKKQPGNGRRNDQEGTFHCVCKVPCTLCEVSPDFSCMEDMVKPILLRYLPMLKERSENSEQKISLHGEDVPDKFLCVLFFLPIYIAILTVATFWEVFIFDESFKCETDPKYTCFKDHQIITCSDSTNATGIHCYKFAFNTTHGVSSAAVVLGAGTAAFGVITFILMSLMKCNKYCTNITQVIGFVLTIAAFVTQIALHFTTDVVNGENILEFGAFLLVIASAILLPVFMIGCFGRCARSPSSSGNAPDAMAEVT